VPFKKHLPFLFPFGENAEGKRGCLCAENNKINSQLSTLNSHPFSGKIQYVKERLYVVAFSH